MASEKDKKSLEQKIKEIKKEPSKEGGAEQDPTAKAILDLKDDLEKQAKNVDRIYTLMFFGFLVMLVMVAGILAPIIWNYKEQVGLLRKDQYQFLEQRVQYLEKQASSSAK